MLQGAGTGIAHHQLTMKQAKESTTSKTVNPDTSIVEIEARVAELAVKHRALADETEKLAVQLRAVRGTREVTPQPTATPTRHRVHDTAATELYAKVRELVTDRPMRFRELVEATNADENKIKTCIVRMQRDEIGLKNFGNQYQALWFIPDEKLIERLTKPKNQ